jgi:hypothetical protein
LPLRQWQEIQEVLRRASAGDSVIKGRNPSQSLNIFDQKDIKAAFGRTELVQRDGEHTLFHYPERQLTIAWNDRGQRVDFVRVSLHAWSPPRFGAPELLRELIDAAPDLLEKGWVLPPDGALRLRYLRIEALAFALGLGSPQEVAEGTFLANRLQGAPRPGPGDCGRRGSRGLLERGVGHQGVRPIASLPKLHRESAPRGDGVPR